MSDKITPPPRLRPGDNPYAPGVGGPLRVLVGREEQIADGPTPPAEEGRASVATKGRWGLGKTVATVFIAIVGGLFVWSVVRDALVGMDYGFALVKWSSEPGVFRTEIFLALCAAIVMFVSVWKIVRSNRGAGQIVMWLGLTLLGLGILSYRVGQTGFQVVAPLEPLERRELLYLFLGVISAVIGGLMAFIGAAFMLMKGAKAQPSEADAFQGGAG